jgi:hypothetical protein
MCYGATEESHSTRKLQDASSTSGTARQKPGCVVVRYFRDWLLCCDVLQRVQAESTASQPPRVIWYEDRRWCDGEASSRALGELAQLVSQARRGRLEAIGVAGGVANIEIRRDNRGGSCSMHESQLRRGHG